MRSPESSDQPPSIVSDRSPAADRSAFSERTDLLHRHLTARLASARDELRALEDHSVDPDALVVQVGARVADAQRAVAAERTESDRRSLALLQVADEHAAQVVAEAEAEAHVLRAAAAWLRPALSEIPAHRPSTGPVTVGMTAP